MLYDKWHMEAVESPLELLIDRLGYSSALPWKLALSGDLEQVTSRSPLQPKLFGDC